MNFNSPSNSTNDVRLRKVLNTLFPSNYLKNPSINQEVKLNTNIIKTSLVSTNENDGIGRSSISSQSVTVRASTEPASRLAVLQARYQLNVALKFHQAKLFGCCPIRRTIYEQCFDEVLRQITVNCTEQGLLLFRLRNELKSSLNYYKHLYQSSVAFCINKVMQAEVDLQKINDKVKLLDDKNSKLNEEIYSLKRSSKIKEINEFNQQIKLEAYYKSEIEKRDEIIKQQKSILKQCTSTIV